MKPKRDRLVCALRRVQLSYNSHHGIGGIGLDRGIVLVLSYSNLAHWLFVAGGGTGKQPVRQLGSDLASQHEPLSP